jgi:flagellum-specific peptidoglycan hydrolase FlgJ
MKPQQTFIQQIAPAAVASFAKTGIFPSAVIAQAAFESDWGRKAPGNNLYGIRADSKWKGMTVRFATHEKIDGVLKLVEGTFRAYASWEASMIDHAGFFHDNPRYENALKCTTGPNFCMAIAKAGYATGADYGEALRAMIRDHDMTQFDGKAAA